MPGLILKLSPRERFVANGVVIENGDRRARLNILTPDSNVLRLRDAIHPNEATTPVTRLCYIVQLVIAGEVSSDDAAPQIAAGLEQLRGVFTDEPCRSQLEQAAKEIARDRHYPALRALRALLPAEGHLLALADRP